MLPKWLQILPVFVYKWIARRCCRKVWFQGIIWVQADEYIAIKLKFKKGEGEEPVDHED
jgi:hypothetical protein